MECLYFCITKKDNKEILLESDCEYRLFDFQHLDWGNNTYDVWAVSGDSGTDCFVYNVDEWDKYFVKSGKSTDDIWILENYETGKLYQMASEYIPQNVISYFKEWENK